MKLRHWIMSAVLGAVVFVICYILNPAGPIGQWNHLWESLLIGSVTVPLFVAFFFVADKNANVAGKPMRAVRQSAPPRNHH